MNQIDVIKEQIDFSVRILVISDDQEIAHIWAYGLEQSGLKVSLAEMGEQALQTLADVLPDLVVVDSHTWQGEDIEFCRKLRLETVIPLLLFTSQNDEYYLLQAYAVGVDEVVAQPVSPRLFMAKIHSWLRRTQSIPSAILDELRVGGFLLNLKNRLLRHPDGHSIRLSYLEARLLYLLMSHPNRTQESVRLFEQVWGYYGQGDSILLKNLVYRLRRKIEPEPTNPIYLVTEGPIGYRFNHEKKAHPISQGSEFIPGK